jgi:hypothetical protein
VRDACAAQYSDDKKCYPADPFMHGKPPLTVVVRQTLPDRLASDVTATVPSSGDHVNMKNPHESR